MRLFTDCEGSCGWLDWNILVQPYGPAWRAERRFLHEYFRRGVVHQYHAAQKREVQAFLRRALDFKGAMKGHVINQCVLRVSSWRLGGLTILTEFSHR